jgi:adenosylcobinamide-phosphate synthase
MWELSPLQLLFALGLDIVLGDPRWMPDLRGAVRGVAQRIAVLAGSWFRESLIAGIVSWGLMAGAVIFAFGLAHWILRPLPFLYSLLEVFVVYECIAVADVSRRTRTILQPLRRGEIEAAGYALCGRSATLSEAEISSSAIERIAVDCQRRFLAPLFWVIVAGPAGVLLHCITSELGRQSGSVSRVASVWQGIDTVLGFVPARLLALLSETFRKYRSFGKIRREARGTNRSTRESNDGWSEAALAYDLNVRLGQAPAVYNPAGDSPGPGHVAEAMVWFWRIVSFSTVVALIALR